MLLNITLLLIISLPIFITISTVINKAVKYTVVAKQLKTGTLKILITRVLAPLFI